MANIQICTQMKLPDNLQAQGDSLAIKENSANGHLITSGPKIPDGASGLALPTGSLWANGRTLRVKILNGSSKVKSKIQQYGSLWTQFANLKMVFVDSGDAELRINVDSSNASWSYIGTDNLSIPANQQTMNFGWLTDSTSEDEYSRVIVHEFGHALGCIHEHQSPAAGIPWNKQAVYDYYKRTNNWDQATVDNNIFRLYAASTTQYSQFDTSSIMLYAIPATLTTNGYSTGWNTKLSDTDKAFIGSIYPAESIDVNAFNTQEVRPWNQPAQKAVKRQKFSKPFSGPPSLAVGLTSLDVAQSANIRVTAYADNIKTDSADVHIDTWSDTTLYSAGCTWFGAIANDPDYQIGQFSTQDDHPWNQPQMKTARQITFSRPYSAPPKVVIWLNGLDMAKDKNWRIAASATDITTTGFTIHLDTWSDTVLYSATASWIAYPANKAGVTSGTYNTQDVRPWNQPRTLNSGQVSFPSGKFSGTPRVLVALNGLDVDFRFNLRLGLGADTVSQNGMNWQINSWSDTILYSAGASYIAFT